MLRRVAVYKLLLIMMWVAGCSQSTISGPVSVSLIAPTAEHCGYAISPQTIQTVSNLNEMRGLVGRVVTSPVVLDSDPSILDTGNTFVVPDLHFTKSGDTYGPMDMTSLFSASLYYAIERGYLTFKNLDPKADLASVIPNLPDTYIVNDAQMTDTSSSDRHEEYDNAEYLPHPISNAGNSYILNYFLSFPTAQVKDIPLGINLGIMVHEYTHMVFQQLFYQPGIVRNTQISDSTNKPTNNTLAALDEGLADYFGFLATRDPGYFLCSFPTENRDLSVPKEFTDQVTANLQQGGTNFDPHEGGAVFAAIQFQIGQAIGSFDDNGKALIEFMANLLSCANIQAGPNTVSFSFADIARCHEQQFAGNSRSSVVQSIYQQYLGNTYRGQ